MKKLILLLLVLQLLSFTSFAQEKAKPTKQETMDWIAEKIKAHLSKECEFVWRAKRPNELPDYSCEKFEFVSYEKGIIKLKVTKKVEIATQKITTFTRTISLSKVNEVKAAEGYVAVVGKDVRCEEECYSDFLIYSYKSVGGEATSMFDLFTGSGEPQLIERMVKAFQTLAEYNNAEKPKEAF